MLNLWYLLSLALWGQMLVSISTMNDLHEGSNPTYFTLPALEQKLLCSPPESATPKDFSSHLTPLLLNHYVMQL